MISVPSNYAIHFKPFISFDKNFTKFIFILFVAAEKIFSELVGVDTRILQIKLYRGVTTSKPISYHDPPRYIQNPFQQVRWSFFQKQLTAKKAVNYFRKKFHLSCWA